MPTMELTTEGYLTYINERKNMREGAAELGLLLWPRYPESLATVQVSDLLRSIHSIRVQRIKNTMRKVGAQPGMVLADLDESQREELSNILLRIGNGDS